MMLQRNGVHHFMSSSSIEIRSTAPRLTIGLVLDDAMSLGAPAGAAAGASWMGNIYKRVVDVTCLLKETNNSFVFLWIGSKVNIYDLAEV